MKVLGLQLSVSHLAAASSGSKAPPQASEASQVGSHLTQSPSHHVQSPPRNDGPFPAEMVLLETQSTRIGTRSMPLLNFSLWQILCGLQNIVCVVPRLLHDRKVSKQGRLSCQDYWTTTAYAIKEGFCAKTTIGWCTGEVAQKTLHGYHTS